MGKFWNVVKILSKDYRTPWRAVICLSVAVTFLSMTLIINNLTPSLPFTVISVSDFTEDIHVATVEVKIDIKDDNDEVIAGLKTDIEKCVRESTTENIVDNLQKLIDPYIGKDMLRGFKVSLEVIPG
jgi:hypothetical protein